MQEFVSYKNSGNKKFAQQKFAAAVTDFSYVINKLKVMGTDEAQLKMVCFINRSCCNLMLNKPSEAMYDAEEAMNVYNSVRDKIDPTKIDSKKLADDKLTMPISLAFVRRGQVHEAQANFLAAINDYQTADKIQPEADGKKVLESLFKKLSLPLVDTTDKKLGLFVDVFQNLTDSEKVTNLLGEILQTFLDGKVTPEDIEYYSKKNMHRLVFAVMQIYMNVEIIVIICISINRIFSESDVKDTFNGFPVIRTAMTEWRDNAGIVGDSLRFLSLCPPQLYQSLVDGQMIPTIINSINIELQEEEYDAAFILLFRLATKKEQFIEIGQSNVIEVINKTKTLGGLILLSKLVQVPELARAAKQEGALDWVLERLEQNTNNASVVSAASIFIAQAFLHGDESNSKVQELPSEEEEKKNIEKKKQQASKAVDILFPIAKNNSKDAVLVSNCFAAIAACVEFASQRIHHHHIITAASVMLKMNIDNESVVLNIVSFFYACTQYGLKEEVKEASAAFQTTMEALQKHPTNQLLAERAVAIAVECESNVREDLLALGLKQFPESKMLRKYIGVLNIEKIRENL